MLFRSTGVKVGHVVECGQHPDADKLRVTKVDVGQTDSNALDFQVAYPNENISENRSWENEVTVISSLQEVLHIASR